MSRHCWIHSAARCARLHVLLSRGATWRADTLSQSTRSSQITDCVHGPRCPVQIPNPSVAVDARGRVYLVYTEGTAGHPYVLRFARSDDGGVSWTPSTVISAGNRPSSGDEPDNYYPMIAASGDGLVYVVWFDDRQGPLSVWAKRSIDGGRTWSDDVMLSRPGGMTGIYGEYGGIAIDARGWLHVAWSEGVGHVSAPGGKGGTWYARWRMR